MPFKINHIHIKSPDPRTAAEWYEKAFGFKIVSDETRVFGDRFIRCQADGGMLLSISNARSGETLAPADATAHWGLEHFAIECDDIEADIARLDKAGRPAAGGADQGAQRRAVRLPGRAGRRAHRAAASCRRSRPARPGAEHHSPSPSE